MFAIACALTDEEEWRNYKVRRQRSTGANVFTLENLLQIAHNKNYDAAEDARRYKIFKQVNDENKAHNEREVRGEVSYKKGLNKFSDWTPEERRQMLGYGGNH